jgi:hypothetical protein
MQMNEKQALGLIEEMISKAKSDINESGQYFLLWGWLVFIAAICNYYLLVYTSYEYHSLPWIILMPLGGIVTGIMGYREKKKSPKVKSYVDEALKYVGRAFAISMFLVCFFMPAGEQFKAMYPTIMILYAMWLFICGGMLKFKPLIWGGFLNWIMAAAGYIFASTDTHLILIAIAVLGGYIIPGYLLKRRFNKDVQGA